MKILKITAIALLTTAIFISCKKESNTVIDNSFLQGNGWAFMDLIMMHLLSLTVLTLRADGVIEELIHYGPGQRFRNMDAEWHNLQCTLQ